MLLSCNFLIHVKDGRPLPIRDQQDIALPWSHHAESFTLSIPKEGDSRKIDAAI